MKAIIQGKLTKKGHTIYIEVPNHTVKSIHGANDVLLGGPINVTKHLAYLHGRDVKLTIEVSDF